LPAGRGRAAAGPAGALPHARLLPAHRRRRERRGDAAGDRRRDADGAHVRAPGPRDRPRRRRLDGTEETARLLLIDLTSLAAELAGHQHKARLRFVACGSVDDGKSTLLGRLLFESQTVFDDQLAALERDSRNGEMDLSLLLDGLAAEREQGITIDVAYRY